MIRSFQELTTEEQPLAGGKGSTLARLYQWGFPVPDGFIILPEAFESDLLRPEAWAQALEEHGLDFTFYTHRQRGLDEVFPWDHIDAAVNKKFLRKDYLMSMQGETRIDCRDQCFACGILPKFAETRMQTPANAWECPPVIPKDQRGKKHDGLEIIPLNPA